MKTKIAVLAFFALAVLAAIPSFAVTSSPAGTFQNQGRVAEINSFHYYAIADEQMAIVHMDNGSEIVVLLPLAPPPLGSCALISGTTAGAIPAVGPILWFKTATAVTILPQSSCH